MNQKQIVYFNSTTLVNILIIVSMYSYLDIFVFDYSLVKDFSIAFYIKLAIYLFYWLAANSGRDSKLDANESDVEGAYNFSAAIFGFWFVIVDSLYLGEKPTLYSVFFFNIWLLFLLCLSIRSSFFSKRKN